MCLASGVAKPHSHPFLTDAHVNPVVGRCCCAISCPMENKATILVPSSPSLRVSGVTNSTSTCDMKPSHETLPRLYSALRGVRVRHRNLGRRFTGMLRITG